MSRKTKRKAKAARRKNSPAAAVGVTVPIQDRNINTGNNAAGNTADEPKSLGQHMLAILGHSTWVSVLVALFWVTANGFFNFFSDIPGIQLYPITVAFCFLVFYLFHKYILGHKKSRWFYLFPVIVCLFITIGSIWAVRIKSQSVNRTLPSMDPSVSVMPYASMNSKKTFATDFVLENGGPYEIQKIEWYYIYNVELSGGGDFKNCMVAGKPINSIPRGQRSILQTPFAKFIEAGSREPELKNASVEVAMRFRSSPNSSDLIERHFYFIAKKAENGDVVWEEISK